MMQFQYTVQNPLGLHARPAGLLVQTAKALDSTITVSRGKAAAEATHLIALMTLGVRQGDRITVSAQGGDERASICKMESFFRENL